MYASLVQFVFLGVYHDPFVTAEFMGYSHELAVPHNPFSTRGIRRLLGCKGINARVLQMNLQGYKVGILNLLVSFPDL